MSGNPLDRKSQAWSALFSEPMSELVKRYTASVDFDKRLWRADIDGSLAHAGMLAAQGIIGAQDLADIQRGMAQIAAEIEAGSFEWKLDLEDVDFSGGVVRVFGKGRKERLVPFGSKAREALSRWRRGERGRYRWTSFLSTTFTLSPTR